MADTGGIHISESSFVVQQSFWTFLRPVFEFHKHDEFFRRKSYLLRWLLNERYWICLQDLLESSFLEILKPLFEIKLKYRAGQADCAAHPNPDRLHSADYFAENLAPRADHFAENWNKNFKIKTNFISFSADIMMWTVCVTFELILSRSIENFLKLNSF